MGQKTKKFYGKGKKTLAERQPDQRAAAAGLMA